MGAAIGGPAEQASEPPEAADRPRSAPAAEGHGDRTPEAGEPDVGARVDCYA